MKIRKFFIMSVVVALVACCFLVPVSADYSNGSFEPIVGNIAGFSADVQGVGNVNFDGFTRLNFAQHTHIPYESSQTNTVLATFDIGDCFLYDAGTKVFLPCVKFQLYKDGARGMMLIPVVKISDNNVEVEFPDGSYLLVRTYPFNIADGTSSAWEALEFDAYSVGADTPDVPDVPDVPDEPIDTGSVMGVWSYVMSWISTSLGSVQSIFFQNGSLTFLGVVSIIAVSLGIGWLIIGVVTRFFQLRG